MSDKILCHAAGSKELLENISIMKTVQAFRQAGVGVQAPQFAETALAEMFAHQER